jgi:hypothetical protein
MPRKGRDFELAYEWLYKLGEEKYYEVKSPAYVMDKVTGEKREIDVLVEYLDQDDKKRRIAIECRDRKCNADIIWIEQLRTKKEDCELDYLIATTTSSFSETAAAKARHHGIIIEKAEFFKRELIDGIVDEFMIDIFFIKMELTRADFIMTVGGMKSMKDLIKGMPIHQYFQLTHELNEGLYISIDFYKLTDDYDISRKLFFDKKDNNFIELSKTNDWSSAVKPVIFDDLGVRSVCVGIKIVPFHLSLPLNKSLSVFEVEGKKNKKYSAHFGDDEEYIQCGYIEKDEFFCKKKIKNRKFFMPIGAEMQIDNIFLDIDKSVPKMGIEMFKDFNCVLDFSKIL